MATRRWRLGLLALIVLVQFGLFEWGLRLAGRSEATPVFQQLFMPDDASATGSGRSSRSCYTTPEFSTAIATNAQGVRDADIGPKPAGERRVVVLGDSLVLAVQVPREADVLRPPRRPASTRGAPTPASATA